MAVACSVDDCLRPVTARGMCRSHYQMAWKRDAESWRSGRVNSGACSVDDCDKPSRKRGWCHMHYQRWRAYGDVNRGRVVEPLCKKCGAEKYRNGSGKLYCPACAASTNARNWVANHDLNLERKRAYYARTREEHRVRNQARYLANRESHMAQSREWSLAHPELRRQYARDWYYRNKDQAFATGARRRARVLDAICEHGNGCVTAPFLKAIKTQACVYCGAPAEHADHVVPITRGGLHCQENIVPACRFCNQSKNNRLLDEWKRGAA